MKDAAIGMIGIGVDLPQRVMTNSDWTQYVDTSDEWIRERTGIRQRHIATEDESTVKFAVGASLQALEDAQLSAGDLDEIILATDTPEVFSPDTAAFVQHEIGARQIPAYDLAGSGCAGFLLGMDIARSRIVAAGAKHVLVIGVEVISRVMDWTDRNTSVIFGDAGTAAVIGYMEPDRAPTALQGEVIATVTGTDGSRAEILGKEVGGTRCPFSLELAQENAHNRLIMNGREVFKDAVHHMTNASTHVLEKAGKTIEDVALFVPHQANLRIIQAISKNFKMEEDRVYVNVQNYGNTGSASVPLALWEACKKGRVRAGDLVLLTAFGAGFHWASVLLQY